MPALSGATLLYSDLAVGDVVKVWLGWDAAHSTGDPDFMGSVYQLLGQTGDIGITRVLIGQSNSEVLARRIKSRKVWESTEVDDIVAELASDLSLGSGSIAVDTTSINVMQDTETYMDILKKISDYWYSAGTQVKKDWFVDVNANLVWQARPARTVGVETITNITSYSLVLDRTNIKNAIGVYGALTPFNPTDPGVYGRKYPSDGDDWTYSAVWTATTGSVASNSTSPKVGATCTRLSNSSSPYHLAAYVTLPLTVHVEGVNGYGVLDFYARRHDTGEGIVQLYAPDNSNYFQIDNVSFSDSNDVWQFHRYALGKNNEYDADANPDGWTLTGSPSWEQLTYINFYCDTTFSTSTVDIDGLCFNFGRWRYSPASDATSITNYGHHDLMMVDNNLTTDSMCESRAKTLLYQHKDPVKRLDIKVPGNTNILLGDQLSITIPAENLSAATFYVTAVEHDLINEGWTTTATMLDTVSSRNTPPRQDKEALANALKNLQQMSRHRQRIN